MSVSIRTGWRFTLYFLAGLLLLLLIALTGITLFVSTESGSRRIGEAIIVQLNAMDDITLEIGNMDGNLLRGMQLNQVRFSNDAANASADSIEARWNPYSLFSGNFYLSELILSDLALELISGESSNPEQTKQLIDQFSFQPLPLGISIEEFRINQASLTGLPGMQQDYVLNSLSASIDLDQQQLEISSVNFDSPSLAASGGLSLDLTSGIPFSGSLDWQYQGSPIDSPLGEIESASGTASFSGDVDLMSVQHQLIAPMMIRSDGSLGNLLAGSSVLLDFLHTAQELILPVDAIGPTQLEDVSLHTRLVDGAIELTLDTGIIRDEFPRASVIADGVVRGQSLAINSARIEVAGDMIEGAGEISWDNGISVQSAFQLDVQSPLDYYSEELPVELSDVSSMIGLEIQGTGDNQRIDLQIQNLSGLLNDYPMQGTGNISVVNSIVQVSQLLVSTDNNQISLQGSYGDTLAVDWEIVLPELSQLISTMGGSVNGSGSISGTVEVPEIAGEILVQNFQSGAIQVQDVAVVFEGGDNQYSSSIDVTNANYATETIDEFIESVNVTVSGNLDAQQVDVNLQSEIANLELILSGGFTDIDSWQWQGVLAEAQVDTPLGKWDSAGSTAVEINPQSVRIDDSCWQQRTVELCLALSPLGNTSYEVNATLDNFPLSEFNNLSASDASYLIRLANFPRLPEALTLQGMLSANLEGVLSPDSNPNLSFTVESENALLIIRREIEDEFGSGSVTGELLSQAYDWERLALNGSYQDNNWQLDGVASVAQQNVENTNLPLEGLLEANLAIDATSNLTGTASLNFQNLGWIEAFRPEVTNVQGALQSSLLVAGTLEAPLISGDLEITDGAFTADRLGVSFQNFEISIQGESTGDAQLIGRVSSGEGALQFSGNVVDVFNDDRSVTASLTGNDFQFVELPDLSLTVSPQLNLSGNSDNIHLAGSLDVPLLNLALQELPAAAVDISRDVVVVNFPSDRPDLARSITAEQATLFSIPVTAEVTLRLGEQVHFSGFGLDAEVIGSLDIRQLANGSNLTYGELDIRNGTYQTYGRTLELRQGKLIFFGAYDNPALDIRAVREVNGMTVGVLMNGTLRNISSQLFSTPALADSDIIAVLITGRPFSELGTQDEISVVGAIANLGIGRSQGLTDQIRDRLGLDTLAITNTGDVNSSTLTVGKFLTPDVFIRYGVGLFDNQSKVAVDFSITERIKLQAESGEYQSVDITYRIER